MAGGALFSQNDKTLVDWVKDFRLKKMQMKRKARRGIEGLRVCAILARALKSAEKELRQKQQERYNRWSELQYKLIQNQSQNEQDNKRKEEIAEIWKSEISSLDDFMRNMSQKCVTVNS